MENSETPDVDDFLLVLDGMHAALLRLRDDLRKLDPCAAIVLFERIAESNEYHGRPRNMEWGVWARMHPVGRYAPKDSADWLMTAFAWDRTREGHSYWSGLHHRLELTSRKG